MPGSFACSAPIQIPRPSATLSFAYNPPKKRKHALLFHCGFFLASLPFFFRDSFTFFLILSLRLSVTRLLVSVPFPPASVHPFSSAQQTGYAYFCVSEAWRRQSHSVWSESVARKAWSTLQAAPGRRLFLKNCVQFGSPDAGSYGRLYTQRPTNEHQEIGSGESSG